MGYSSNNAYDPSINGRRKDSIDVLVIILQKIFYFCLILVLEDGEAGDGAEDDQKEQEAHNAIGYFVCEAEAEEKFQLPHQVEGKGLKISLRDHDEEGAVVFVLFNQKEDGFTFGDFIEEGKEEEYDDDAGYFEYQEAHLIVDKAILIIWYSFFDYF